MDYKQNVKSQKNFYNAKTQVAATPSRSNNNSQSTRNVKHLNLNRFNDGGPSGQIGMMMMSPSNFDSHV